MMKKVYIKKKKDNIIIIFTMDECTVFVAIVYEEREGMRHDRGGDDPKIRDRGYIYIYRTRHDTRTAIVGN